MSFNTQHPSLLLGLGSKVQCAPFTACLSDDLFLYLLIELLISATSGFAKQTDPGRPEPTLFRLTLANLLENF